MILLLLGLIFGSFVSALTYRFPRKISNFYGRSFCDSCKTKLYWYDNIPLLSFLFLKAKCRSCKKNISIRYPLIELTSAIGFFLIGFNLIYLSLFLVLLSIFVIDFENQIIPDELIFFGLLLFPHDLLAGFISATLLLLIHLITKGRGMGLGDVKFAVLGGSLVGLNLVPVWFFVAFLTGGFVGSILILLRIAKLKDKIAFGPFLIFAIPITLIWSEKILSLL